MASLTRIEIISIFEMLSSPVFGWERSEEIRIIVWRDHGQLETLVQKHDRSWLRSINRPASREDAAILTSRH